MTARQFDSTAEYCYNHYQLPGRSAIMLCVYNALYTKQHPLLQHRKMSRRHPGIYRSPEVTSHRGHTAASHVVAVRPVASLTPDDQLLGHCDMLTTD